jgi:hypothetical protein
MREFSGGKLKQKGFFHSAGSAYYCLGEPLIISCTVAGFPYPVNLWVLENRAVTTGIGLIAGIGFTLLLSCTVTGFSD